LFAVTRSGEIYACGESTNGRLGLGPVTGNVPKLRLIDSLCGIHVKKLAVHSGGRHCLAVTVLGKLFSWGEGEDGKLGHENRE
jgi:E3 ubiquitin-protein ligase HERC2